MPKKQKRRVPGSPSANTRPAATTVSATPATRPAASSYEFTPDYSYVIKDLKRIAIMAVLAVTILVALSFFLR